MVLSIALALLAVSLWVRAVGPMLAESRAAETQTGMAGRAGPEGVSTMAAATAGTLPVADSSSKALKSLIRGVLLLSFLLICLLLIVGIIATMRESFRVRSGSQAFSSRKSKTVYTDAWRIAGRRVDLPPASEESPHESGTDEDGPPPR